MVGRLWLIWMYGTLRPISLPSACSARPAPSSASGLFSLSLLDGQGDFAADRRIFALRHLDAAPGSGVDDARSRPLDRGWLAGSGRSGCTGRVGRSRSRVPIRHVLRRPLRPARCRCPCSMGRVTSLQIVGSSRRALSMRPLNLESRMPVRGRRWLVGSGRSGSPGSLVRSARCRCPYSMGRVTSPRMVGSSPCDISMRLLNLEPRMRRSRP